MKDYYGILGVPEDCSDADIRKAFRKLAFEHHPDTNPGREKEAEARFKEINEAYGVLGDKAKRQQYDAARKGGFAGAGYRPGGFQYSQQDIFNGIFSNRAMYEDLNRMFAQGGLRFDQDFLNRVFFSGGQGIRFQFFNGAGGFGGTAQPNAPARKPNWLERLLGRVVNGLFRFVFKRMFQLPNDAGTRPSLDHHADLELSPAEAAAGGEKQISHIRDGQIKKLLVKIPRGVKTNTKIRLKGMGKAFGGRSGDLYLHVKIKGQLG